MKPSLGGSDPDPSVPQTARPVESPAWQPIGAPEPIDPAVDQLVEAVLSQRGIEGEARARFLAPSPEHLEDPHGLLGLDAAVARIDQAAERRERVAVLGDYDVDGITAAALTIAVLRASGIDVVPFIPHRLRDGYGFSVAFVERALELDCTLFVALDCGTNDLEAVERALSAGLDVLVVDHHLPSLTLPEAAILINPKQPGCSYPFKDLCAAGLAFKVAAAVVEARGLRVPASALFRIACLGTIADMVPLLGENRVIAAEGLRTLADTPSPGLQALLRESGTRRPVTAEDVGFRIGPRINAVGRMAEPTTALDLLLTRDAEEATRLAAELNATNHQRRSVEARVFEEALEQVTAQDPLPPFLVAWKEGWARGVLGIAAGRLARRFHRPCVLLAVEDSVASGSGRSIPQIHLHDFLMPWNERYRSFGGHAQALGIAVDVAEIDALHELWLEAARSWPAEALRKVSRYGGRFSSVRHLADLCSGLARLAPFGMGNPEPVLLFEHLRRTGVRRFGAGHAELQVESRDGSEAHLLGWGWQERLDLFDVPCDVLGVLAFDSYKKRPVIRLLEARPALAEGYSADDGTVPPRAAKLL